MFFFLDAMIILNSFNYLLKILIVKRDYGVSSCTHVFHIIFDLKYSNAFFWEGRGACMRGRAYSIGGNCAFQNA